MAPTADGIIVIPCYNEAERLPVDTLRGFLRARSCDFRVVLVDDGSTDATLEVLTSFANEFPCIVEVISLRRNCGKAEAVRAGMCYATRHEPDTISFTDADLATSLDEVASMMSTIIQNDRLIAVFGARIRMMGKHVERSTYRHIIGRVFATAISLILGVGIYDSQCGAKAFRNCADIRDVFAKPFISRWLFDVEIVARIIGCRQENGIVEVPLQSWRDVAGSKVRWFDGVRCLIDLSRIWYHYRVVR